MDSDTALRELLEKIASERNYRQPQITIKTINSGGANYTSAIYLATIAAPNQPDIKAFAKVATIGEEMRLKMNTDRMFGIERFAYTELITTYQSFQDKYNIPNNERLVFPIFYGCNPERLKETVVLEDLISKGYTNFNRFKSFSWEYAAAAITALARWHALCFIYEYEDPEEYNKVINKMVYEFSEDNDDSKKIFETMAQGATIVVQDKHKGKLVRFLEDSAANPEEFRKYYLPREGMAKVLAHGDFRPSNLMSKSEDGKLQIIPVDYQTISVTSPVNDLIYFIFTGSDSQFRKLYYKHLLDHYHRQLSLELERFNLKVEQVYPRSKFDSELRESMNYALLVAIFLLPIVTVEPNLAPNMDSFGDAPIAPNELYAQRLNGIVDDLVEWGYL